MEDFYIKWIEILKAWSWSLILSLGLVKHLGNWFIFIHASSWNLRLLKSIKKAMQAHGLIINVYFETYYLF